MHQYDQLLLVYNCIIHKQFWNNIWSETKTNLNSTQQISLELNINGECLLKKTNVNYRVKWMVVLKLFLINNC